MNPLKNNILFFARQESQSPSKSISILQDASYVPKEDRLKKSTIENHHNVQLADLDACSNKNIKSILDQPFDIIPLEMNFPNLKKITIRRFVSTLCANLKEYQNHIKDTALIGGMVDVVLTPDYWCKVLKSLDVPVNEARNYSLSLSKTNDLVKLQDKNDCDILISLVSDEDASSDTLEKMKSIKGILIKTLQELLQNRLNYSQVKNQYFSCLKIFVDESNAFLIAKFGNRQDITIEMKIALKLTVSHLFPEDAFYVSFLEAIEKKQDIFQASCHTTNWKTMLYYKCTRQIWIEQPIKLNEKVFPRLISHLSCGKTCQQEQLIEILARTYSLKVTQEQQKKILQDYLKEHYAKDSLAQLLFCLNIITIKKFYLQSKDFEIDLSIFNELNKPTSHSFFAILYEMVLNAKNLNELFGFLQTCALLYFHQHGTSKHPLQPFSVQIKELGKEKMICLQLYTEKQIYHLWLPLKQEFSTIAFKHAKDFYPLFMTSFTNFNYANIEQDVFPFSIEFCQNLIALKTAESCHMALELMIKLSPALSSNNVMLIKALPYALLYYPVEERLSQLQSLSPLISKLPQFEKWVKKSTEDTIKEGYWFLMEDLSLSQDRNTISAVIATCIFLINDSNIFSTSLKKIIKQLASHQKMDRAFYLLQKWIKTTKIISADCIDVLVDLCKLCTKSQMKNVSTIYFEEILSLCESVVKTDPSILNNDLDQNKVLQLLQPLIHYHAERSWSIIQILISSKEKTKVYEELLIDIAQHAVDKPLAHRIWNQHLKQCSFESNNHKYNALLAAICHSMPLTDTLNLLQDKNGCVITPIFIHLLKRDLKQHDADISIIMTFIEQIDSIDMKSVIKELLQETSHLSFVYQLFKECVQKRYVLNEVEEPLIGCLLKAYQDTREIKIYEHILDVLGTVILPRVNQGSLAYDITSFIETIISIIEKWEPSFSKQLSNHCLKAWATQLDPFITLTLVEREDFSSALRILQTAQKKELRFIKLTVELIESVVKKKPKHCSELFPFFRLIKTSVLDPFEERIKTAATSVVFLIAEHDKSEHALEFIEELMHFNFKWKDKLQEMTWSILAASIVSISKKNYETFLSRWYKTFINLQLPCNPKNFFERIEKIVNTFIQESRWEESFKLLNVLHEVTVYRHEPDWQRLLHKIWSSLEVHYKNGTEGILLQAYSMLNLVPDLIDTTFENHWFLLAYALVEKKFLSKAWDMYFHTPSFFHSEGIKKAIFKHLLNASKEHPGQAEKILRIFENPHYIAMYQNEPHEYVSIYSTLIQYLLKYKFNQNLLQDMIKRLGEIDSVLSSPEVISHVCAIESVILQGLLESSNPGDWCSALSKLQFLLQKLKNKELKQHELEIQQQFIDLIKRVLPIFDAKFLSLFENKKTNASADTHFDFLSKHVLQFIDDLHQYNLKPEESYISAIHVLQRTFHEQSEWLKNRLYILDELVKNEKYHQDVLDILLYSVSETNTSIFTHLYSLLIDSPYQTPIIHYMKLILQCAAIDPNLLQNNVDTEFLKDYFINHFKEIKNYLNCNKKIYHLMKIVLETLLSSMTKEIEPFSTSDLTFLFESCNQVLNVDSNSSLEELGKYHCVMLEKLKEWMCDKESKQFSEKKSLQIVEYAEILVSKILLYYKNDKKSDSLIHSLTFGFINFYEIVLMDGSGAAYTRLQHIYQDCKQKINLKPTYTCRLDLFIAAYQQIDINQIYKNYKDRVENLKLITEALINYMMDSPSPILNVYGIRLFTALNPSEVTFQSIRILEICESLLQKPVADVYPEELSNYLWLVFNSPTYANIIGYNQPKNPIFNISHEFNTVYFNALTHFIGCRFSHLKNLHEAITILRPPSLKQVAFFHPTTRMQKIIHILNLGLTHAIKVSFDPSELERWIIQFKVSITVLKESILIKQVTMFKEQLKQWKNLLESVKNQPSWDHFYKFIKTIVDAYETSTLPLSY